MTIDQPVGLTATHGEEARWHMASVQRLPPPQQCNSTGDFFGLIKWRRVPVLGPKSQQ
jgi:hypothetical protein